MKKTEELRFGTDGCGKVGFSITVGGDDAPIGFILRERTDTDDRTKLVYENTDRGLTVKTKVERTGEVYCQTNELTTERDLVLTENVTEIGGICDDAEGIASRLGDGSIVVWFCLNHWQGEGQWRSATPEDLGIYFASTHPWETAKWRLDSVSSWSSGSYYPLMLIEDKKRKETWFFETEGGHSWKMELCASGALNVRSLFVRFGGADERLGFVRKMKTGESAYSATAFYGVVRGGFEQAVQTLTVYKRKTSLVACDRALVFNDYMNCNWDGKSRELLLPLIGSAAKSGAEVFCLDANWHKALGVWEPDDDKFGEEKLQGVFDEITSYGMKIGVWFEFETIPADMNERLGADDCFLMRNGERIAPYRPIANFRSEKLRSYLNLCVEKMYAMGVRYIKNDHNNVESVGTTLYGESAAEGLENNAKAFITFIDGLTEKYPDLTIENCGSGALRSDHGTLKHFHLQSTSDQENYLFYPSILTGSLALMPPEKAGIWCYPYPLPFEERGEKTPNAKALASFADGEQTVFNMINGCMGQMYLSGKIHLADEKNAALIKEGVELYKSLREFISRSVPVFPSGMIRISSQTGHSVGLTDGREILLAVWNLSDKELSVAVDLSAYGKSTCEQIYPHRLDGFTWVYTGRKLICNFSKGRSARLFLLK